MLEYLDAVATEAGLSPGLKGVVAEPWDRGAIEVNNAAQRERGISLTNLAIAGRHGSGQRIQGALWKLGRARPCQHARPQNDLTRMQGLPGLT